MISEQGQPENKNNDLKLYKSEVRKIVARALGKDLPETQDEPVSTFENHKEIKSVKYESVQVKQTVHCESVVIENGQVISHVKSDAENEQKGEKQEEFHSIEHESGTNEKPGNLGLYKSRVQAIVARALGMNNQKEESSSDFENKNQIKTMNNNESKSLNPNEENNEIMNVESLK